MPIAAAFIVPHPPLIIPEIGKGAENKVSATIESYHRISREIAALEPETVVIISPHSVLYADYFHISPGASASGSFRSFGAPDVTFRVAYDEEFSTELSALAQSRDFPAGTAGRRSDELDHGTMVPLWFIQQQTSDFKVVRIGLSGLSLIEHYRLGEMIAEVSCRLNRKTVIVASGDLSHKLQEYGPYGFAEEGPEYDRRLIDACERGSLGELLDFSESLCSRAAECGHRSFTIMAGTLDGLDVTARVYSHEDVTGVGYGICSFYPGSPDPSRHFAEIREEKELKRIADMKSDSDAWVALARSSVEHYILKGEKLPIPENLPPPFYTAKAGVFVSIHKFGSLRGCIGTIAPATENIAEEIISNAVSASSRDPRFAPIEPEELKWLEINVDVLEEPEKIDSPDQLDVREYGVIVTSGGRRGLLLPDLEGVDTVEQQIDIARRKAGIPDGEKVSLQRFKVTRHR